MELPRREYWSGFPFPSPGDRPHPEIKPASRVSAGRFLTAEPPGKPLASLTESLSTYLVLGLLQSTHGSSIVMAGEPWAGELWRKEVTSVILSLGLLHWNYKSSKWKLYLSLYSVERRWHISAGVWKNSITMLLTGRMIFWSQNPNIVTGLKLLFDLRTDGFVLSKRNRTMSWIRGRGYIYILMADSCCFMAETNTIL